MKRGSSTKVLILSAILIISISLVSASLIGDILKNVFGITGKTITSGEEGCYDSDGYGGFSVDGYVKQDGIIYPDKCSLATATDYYCDTGVGDGDTAPGEKETPLFILPFGKDSITGAATGLQSSITKDCAAEGKECIGAGVCGCDTTKTYACSNPAGTCTGSFACVNGNLASQCTYSPAPTTETCDGKDNDCDGTIDGTKADTWCVNLKGTGYICQNSQCFKTLQSSCTDTDGDRYSVQTDPNSCGNSCSGQSCLGGSDCNDNNAAIKPGATESCTDGVDNDCDGLTDSADTADCACTPKTQAVACADKYGAGYACGTASDGCDRVLNCGTCNTGSQCTLATGRCAASPICEDSDGDGYGRVASSLCTYSSADCDDNDDARKPGNDETCDAAGKDNDCNSLTLDSNIASSSKCQPTSSSGGGTCLTKVLACTSGAMQTCESLGFKTASATEIPNDDIDNNCDGTIDEGSECTTGEEKSCGNTCAPGTQRCVANAWGTCDLISNPDLPSSCEEPPEEGDCDTVGDIDLCGTNVGECMVGSISCLSDNTWGECTAVGPATELCDDGRDNDCDGASDLDDLDCGGARGNIGAGGDSSSDDGSSAVDTSSVTTSGSQEAGKTATTKELAEKEFSSLNFFQKLFRVIQSIFNVGRSIVGLSIDTPEEIRCSDSDGGKDYFQKGTGNGLNLQDNQVWFVDFCYKDTTSNQVEKCGGDNCYLTEYICDGSYMQTETQVACKFGCANGACIPDASLGEDCRYFDRDRWEWVNRC